MVVGIETTCRKYLLSPLSSIELVPILSLPRLPALLWLLWAPSIQLLRVSDRVLQNFGWKLRQLGP